MTAAPGQTASLPDAEVPACFHCGLPAADHKRYRLVVEGIERPFCCPGCQAVADTIVTMGMSSYYRQREQCAPGTIPSAALVPAVIEEMSAWDVPELAGAYVSDAGNGLQTTTLMITGITCAACAWLIETRLTGVAGVRQFRLNLSTHRAVVTWAPSDVSLSTIIRAVASVGYQAEPWNPDREDTHRRQEHRRMLMRMGLAGLGAMQVMMLAVGLYAGAAFGIELPYERFLRWVSALVTLPVLLYSGQPFLAGARNSLRQRQTGMDVPVAIALLMAYGSSVYSTITNGPDVYFDSVCMFIFFLLLGRFLEMRARHHAATSALGAAGSRTLTARRLQDDGSTVLLPADRLQVGDHIQVRAGDVIACDGCVLDGESSVNEAMLTGEALPVAKTIGDTVMSGSINIDHPLTIEVTRPAQASTMNVLRRLLDQAQGEKPRLALIADRIANKAVARVLIFTVLTWIGWYFVDPDKAFWVALSVLVITCPCALGLAMPTALTSATTALSELGLLVTRAHVLETLNDLRHVVFDKTGTLTEGHFEVVECRPLGSLDAADCASLARGLEAGSEHPVARAFHVFQSPDEAARQVRILPNRGIEGELRLPDGSRQRLRIGVPAFVCDAAGKPVPALGSGHWLILASDTALLCAFRIEDRVRAGARALVEDLAARGIRLHLLSGDHSDHPRQLAAQLDISEVRAGQTPEQKLAYVRTLQRDGKVLMLGDGLNDAPVLAAADVSIAMAAGSDLAKVTADALLLNNRLGTLTDALQIARFNHRVVRQNMAWAVIYNTAAVPFAALGLVPPWAAAIGMSASSLIVVMNSWRIRRLGRQLANALKGEP